MPNPFGKNGGPQNSVKRTTKDLSFQNNVTMNFGDIVPVFCKEVLPGDSFKIDTTFGLRFMPLVFPIQTRMRADLHFFYVRNRNLWKDWPDFIGRTKEGLTPPYMQFTKEQQASCGSTCSLGDYLGLPSYMYGLYGSEHFYTVEVDEPLQRLRALSSTSLYATLSGDYPFSRGVNSLVASLQGAVTGGFNNTVISFENFSYDSTGNYSASTIYGLSSSGPEIHMNFVPQKLTSEQYTLSNNVVSFLPLSFPIFSSTPPDSGSAPLFQTYRVVPIVIGLKSDGKFEYPRLSIGPGQTFVYGYQVSEAAGETFVNSGSFQSQLDENVSGMEPSTFMFDNIDDIQEFYCLYMFYVPVSSSDYKSATYYIYNPSDYSIGGNIYSQFSYQSKFVSNGADITDSAVKNPFASESGTPHIPISALPFRAYESIYNSFYRDDRNNPFYKDGEPQYNDYITTHEGGSDKTVYKIEKRQWEQDFLTTAVPSPQQGEAPLVGISSTGVMTFSDADGQTYSVQAETADDNDTIVGYSVTESLPSPVRRSLVNYASSGISINDFRNVNAFQRWLETNIRRGLKYRDQIKSHFDVDISYQELDMPEFIGGVSQNVDVTQINQTSESNDDNPLGSYAGQAFAVGNSKHSVDKYCDEHGFIIGVLSVVPVPNYSQLLPKFFTKLDAFDYYFPEFGHIGMQAIPYKEVCPIQYCNSDEASSDSGANATFGYQRAWYDYLQSVDEVHGLFRSQLRNFVLNRSFDTVPTLSPSFLNVDHNQLNDVFAVTESSHKILGQIYFNVSAKRPIPQFGVPRLE